MQTRIFTERLPELALRAQDEQESINESGKESFVRRTTQKCLMPVAAARE
jgi:hypothetical protein